MGVAFAHKTDRTVLSRVARANGESGVGKSYISSSSAKIEEDQDRKSRLRRRGRRI